MKNPWKRYSKVNPQRENGNRQIANDVYQALISGNFLGSEYKLIFAVISKTWGFNKPSDIISIKQFQEMTNLKRRTIQSILKKLKRQRVLYSAPSKVRAQTGSPLNSFLFNKHYDTWKVEGCNITEGCNIEHPLESEKGAKECKTRVSQVAPTKESIKESIKEKEHTAFDNAEIYITKKKRKITGKRLETFMLFWEAFDYKRGKAEATDVWLDILTLTDKIVDQIVIAAKAEAKRRPNLRANGDIPKMAQGWLSGKRWEDEIQKQEPKKHYVD